MRPAASSRPHPHSQNISDDHYCLNLRSGLILGKKPEQALIFTLQTCWFAFLNIVQQQLAAKNALWKRAAAFQMQHECHSNLSLESARLTRL